MTLISQNNENYDRELDCEIIDKEKKYSKEQDPLTIL